MTHNSLYNQKNWDLFLERNGLTEKDFSLKTYPQFDPFFNLLVGKEKLRKQLSDSSLKAIAQHPFLPFVKILTKTPRYRYQDSGDYELETKIRPISFASHYDTYIYAFYACALTEKYQEYIKRNEFEECVLAYRTDLEGKCNIQFAKEVFQNVKNFNSQGKECTAIALDISGYFDNIDHQLLKEKWCKILNDEGVPLPIDQYNVFRSLTNYSYVGLKSFLSHFNIDLEKLKKDNSRWRTLLDLIPDTIAGPDFNAKFGLLRERKLLVANLPKKENDKFPRFKGIPQGSAMSSVLSNIYLIDFDKWLFAKSKAEGFVYRRYCDDLIIICDSHRAADLNVLVLNEIKKYLLQIQDKKTELIEFKLNSKGKVRAFDRKKIEANKVTLEGANEQKYYKNLQYLGFEFNGENIYIRPGSLSRYFRKMKERIVKSVLMAYGNKGRGEKIFRKQIFKRYSHLGDRNFTTYALNAAKKTYVTSEGNVREGMDSKSITKQLSAHFAIIEREIAKTSIQRYSKEPDKMLKRKLKGKKRKIRKVKM